MRSLIDNAKSAERLRVLQEMLALVVEVQHDAGDLVVFEYRLHQRCKDAMKAVKP